jgi:hypothetical protein
VLQHLSNKNKEIYPNAIIALQKINNFKPGSVVYACNSSYSGGRGWRSSSRPAPAKLASRYLKNSVKTKEQGAGGMAGVVRELAEHGRPWFPTPVPRV